MLAAEIAVVAYAALRSRRCRRRQILDFHQVSNVLNKWGQIDHSVRGRSQHVFPRFAATDATSTRIPRRRSLMAR